MLILSFAPNFLLLLLLPHPNRERMALPRHTPIGRFFFRCAFPPTPPLAQLLPIFI
jgi:hypothetical protein